MPFHAVMLTILALLFSITFAEPSRPNILWISCEDISPHIGCFGDPHAITPNLDQLAKEGVRYSNAFTAAGVCAPCRSTIITGMYQTSLGTHHMRCKATLPPQVKPFPAYLREAGYFCTNSSKQDYQFSTPKGTWDASSRKAHWKNREDGQPFFAVFNFTGCHESGIASQGKYNSVTRNLKPEQRQDAEKLTTLPPYYPDTPVTREDWKRNYELITAMDAWAGRLIQEIKDAGLYEETIIMFWSDHGVGLPRAKRWLYDSGTHIPFIVRVPAKFRSGGQGSPNTVTDELISSVDFGPTVLNLAGLEVPEHVQGRAFLGANLTPDREYVYGARDRMDERYDTIRMVRNKRYRYIRNYEPLKTYYQHMNTPEKGATMREIRRLQKEGNLPATARLFTAPRKPVEELYDLKNDPHEIENLAEDRKHSELLHRMRAAHLEWVQETKDVGLIPEPELAFRKAKVGSEYAILRQPGGDELQKRVSGTAVLASEGKSALPKLMAAMKDEDAAVRYWGATGIGNIGSDAVDAETLMADALKDSSPVVRIAASRALCRMKKPEAALPVLIAEMQSKHQWGRLHAAIVLDEIEDMARPAIEALKKGLKNQPNKYITRVANRALNDLLGTDNKVR
ncbi:MAG: sulfatase-like hydrolase/transferase [Planctomycetota bacterium]|jgi:uncharacterized sulfatase|nr:sulfatase-like hydrolase/transferase [Planctomycetota bacterium]